MDKRGPDVLHPPIHREVQQSYVPGYTTFGLLAGVAVHGMVNAMRRRPIMYGACVCVCALPAWG
jgi:hypothetical protein